MNKTLAVADSMNRWAMQQSVLRSGRALRPGALAGLRAFGDVNSDAAAALTAAGYKNVVCAPQVVNNLGGNYTQNQCTASNASGAMNADDVLMLSPGNLALQFGAQNSVFSPVNTGTLTSKGANVAGTSFVIGPQSPTSPGGGVYSASQLQNDFNLAWNPATSSYVSTATPPPASTSASTSSGAPFDINAFLAALKGSGSSTSTAPTTTATNTILGMDPTTLLLVGGGALALIFLMKG
jgi:hypothetical protein